MEAVDHRDDGDHDLREKFRARAHAHDVVPHAHQHDERAAEEESEEVLRVVRPVEERGVKREADADEERADESEINGDAADAGLGIDVHAALVDDVEHADFYGELANLRRREERGDERGNGREQIELIDVHVRPPAVACSSVPKCASATPASASKRCENGSSYGAS